MIENSLKCYLHLKKSIVCNVEKQTDEISREIMCTETFIALTLAAFADFSLNANSAMQKKQGKKWL